LDTHIVEIIKQTLATTHIKFILGFLSAPAYGFFATGALFYLFFVTRKWWFFSGATIVGVLSTGSDRTAELVMLLLFVLAMLNAYARLALSNRIFLFIGFISYPLYLLHENMMVAMIVKIGRAYSHMPTLVIPMLPIIMVCGLAWVIARYLEPASKRLLDKRAFANIRARVASRLARTRSP
jgi:peptidoglycan/LPS O-acetylase OafA/YrhL